jgi:hypothetical protein
VQCVLQKKIQSDYRNAPKPNLEKHKTKKSDVSRKPIFCKNSIHAVKLYNPTYSNPPQISESFVVVVVLFRFFKPKL